MTIGMTSPASPAAASAACATPRAPVSSPLAPRTHTRLPSQKSIRSWRAQANGDDVQPYDGGDRGWPELTVT